jgi:hypothetical protein
MKKIDGDITEDAFQRIKAMVGSDEDDEQEHDPILEKNVNLVFSTQERYDIYEEVLFSINSGEDPRSIAQRVVGILNSHITKRMKLADDRKKAKSPIFRRVG